MRYTRLFLICMSLCGAALSAWSEDALNKPNIEKLHVVLLADEKDHGPAGNGLHDYPLWQKRWALLLGGEKASEEKQVNLVEGIKGVRTVFPGNK